MYCPNCAAQNNKKQNYCRFCGLRLADIEKLYLNQIIFGEESERLKNLRIARKLIEYVTILLFALTFVGLFVWFFYDSGIGKSLTRISLLSYFLLQAARALIGYIQRQSSKESRDQNAVGEIKENEFAAKETSRLIEEKPFAPASSVTEAETELLYAKKNSGKLS